MPIANPFDDPEVAEAYTTWSERKVRWRLGYPLLFGALGLPAGAGPVLDVGCGHGDVAAEVARRFAVPVLAVDPSATMLRIARRDHPHPAVTYFQAEGHRLGFLGTGSVAAAYCAFLMVGMHTKEAMRALVREIARTLRPGGRFAVLEQDRDGLPAGEGDRVPFTFGDEAARRVTIRHWPVSTYAEALREEGFGDLRIDRSLAADAAGLASTGSYLVLTGTRTA